MSQMSKNTQSKTVQDIHYVTRYSVQNEIIMIQFVLAEHQNSGNGISEFSHQ